MAARGASPGLALLLGRVPLEPPLAVALRTVGVLPVRGVSLTPQVLQAGLVVGELALELVQRVEGLRRLGTLRVVAVRGGNFYPSSVEHTSDDMWCVAAGIIRDEGQPGRSVDRPRAYRELDVLAPGLLGRRARQERVPTHSSKRNVLVGVAKIGSRSGDWFQPNGIPVLGASEFPALDETVKVVADRVNAGAHAFCLQGRAYLCRRERRLDGLGHLQHLLARDDAAGCRVAARCFARACSICPASTVSRATSAWRRVSSSRTTSRIRRNSSSGCSARRSITVFGFATRGSVPDARGACGSHALWWSAIV